MHSNNAGMTPEEVRGNVDRPVVLRSLFGETTMDQSNAGATRPWYKNVKIAIGLLAVLGSVAYYGVNRLEQWHASKVSAEVAKNFVVGTEQLAAVDTKNAQAVNLAAQARAAGAPEAVIEIAHAKLGREVTAEYSQARANMAPVIAAVGDNVPEPLKHIVTERTTLEQEADDLLKKFKAGELAQASYNPPAVEQTASDRARSYYQPAARPAATVQVNPAAASATVAQNRTIVSPNPAPAREVSPQISNANPTVLVAHTEPSVANDNPNDGFRFRVGSK